MSNHQKMYGICQNKCLVETIPKAKFDVVENKVMSIEEYECPSEFILKTTFITTNPTSKSTWTTTSHTVQAYDPVISDIVDEAIVYDSSTNSVMKIKNFKAPRKDTSKMTLEFEYETTLQDETSVRSELNSALIGKYANASAIYVSVGSGNYVRIDIERDTEGKITNILDIKVFSPSRRSSALTVYLSNTPISFMPEEYTDDGYIGYISDKRLPVFDVSIRPSHLMSASDSITSSFFSYDADTKTFTVHKDIEIRGFYNNAIAHVNICKGTYKVSDSNKDLYFMGTPISSYHLVVALKYGGGISVGAGSAGSISTAFSRVYSFTGTNSKYMVYE